MDKVVFALTMALWAAPGWAQDAAPPTTPPKAEKSVAATNAAPARKTPPPPNKATTIKKVMPTQKVTLTDGTRTVTRTARELGLSPTPDLAGLKASLTRIAPKFAQAAVNAKPYAYKGRILISPGAYSRALNVTTTAQNILTTFQAKPSARTFSIVLDKKPPVLTAERLKGIDGVLASVTTTAWVAEGRNKNIRLGVGRIDGTLLSPGEIFSLNETVGPRTKDSGFKKAPIFVDAEKVDGFGGGISQVTGTMFNAAARAGLQIIEANLHSQPVKYLPVGQDATVAWGDKDMRFKNNTSVPVYVALSFAKQKLTATLYGKKTPGQIVTLKPVVQRLGEGKVDAQLYRVIKVNGQLVSKEQLVSHKYRWNPE